MFFDIENSSIQICGTVYILYLRCVNMFVKETNVKRKTVNVISDFIRTPTIAMIEYRGDFETELRKKFNYCIVRYIEESNTVVINRDGV